MEDLERRFQILAGLEASERLGMVRKKLQTLQKLAAER